MNHTILYQKSKNINGCKNKADQENKNHGICLSISQSVLKRTLLEQKIMKLRKVNLPNQITVEAIQYGQCPDVPAELSEFCRNLFTGSKN